MSHTLLVGGDRVWINNTKYRNRPGRVLSISEKYLKVLYPVKGNQETGNFRDSSLTKIVDGEFEKWCEKWRSLFAGEHSFD